MSRELAFSVSISDCRVDTFTCGGKGGSGKDTSNNGVRITHAPSGAVGEARDSRNQLQNKRAAWRRMGEHPKFRLWAQQESARLLTGKTIEQVVDEQMHASNLKFEVRNADGQWQEDIAQCAKERA